MKNNRSLWQTRSYIPEPNSSEPNGRASNTEKQENAAEQNPLLLDFSDMDEVRKAFVMSELINRKY